MEAAHVPGWLLSSRRPEPEVVGPVRLKGPVTMADMDAAEAKRAAWRVRLESARRDREALLRTLRDVQARRNLQVLSRGVELASRRRKPVLRPEPASPLRHVQKKEIARPLVESLSQARKAYN